MAEKIVSTGIERLDEALINGEGVVLGSSILIEGSSGSGKELLSKQFALVSNKKVFLSLNLEI